MFLYAENPGVPQQVGAVVLMEGGHVELDDFREAIATRVRAIPELRRRIVPARNRWSRPRWVVDAYIDVDSRIHEVALRTKGDGPLNELVGRFFAVALDPSCSPWEILLVRGSPAISETGRYSVVVKVHHALGDSFTLIAALGGLLDQAPGQWSLKAPELAPSPNRWADLGLARAGRVVNGLACMLAAGRVKVATVRPEFARGHTGPAGAQTRPASGHTGPGGGQPTSSASAKLQYVHFSLQARAATMVARQLGTNVPDLLLALVAEATSNRQAPEPDISGGASLRVMVPHSVRCLAHHRPRNVSGKTTSNRTAGVLLDLPIGPMAFTDRVTAVRQLHDKCLRRGDAEAAAFVLWAMDLVPAVLQRRWARAFYSGAWLGLIVSVFPGMRRPCRLLGEGITAVYPVLALAEGTNLAVGAMTWGTSMSVSLLGSDMAPNDLGALANEIERCFYDCSGLARKSKT